MDEALLGDDKMELNTIKKVRAFLMFVVSWICQPYRQWMEKRDLVRAKVVVESEEGVNQADFYGETALMKAAGDGNLAVVHYLVEAGADVNAEDDTRKTALVHAASTGNNFEIIKFLVQSGANVNPLDLSGTTALMCAALNGDLVVVRFLIEVGANVNLVDFTKRTALMYAVKNDHLEIAQLLLELGADIEAVNLKLQTPLLQASQKQNLDTVQFLVENKADVNAADHLKMTSLMHAALKNNLKMARFLVKSGADVDAVDENGSTVLIRAVEKTDFRIVKFLIESGADVNAVNNVGKTALMKASEGGDLKVARLLIENGADVNATDSDKWTSVVFAAANGKSKIVDYLVASGADATDLETHKNKMLMNAVESGKLDVIRYLLGANSTTDAPDQTGRTLLMCAAELGPNLGRMDIVQFLVESGADVNAVDDYKCTPILYASRRRNWDIVRFLVSKGADVNAFDSREEWYGSTALLCAAQWNQLDIIPFLVEAGADVNAATSGTGSTTLWYAARWIDVNAVKFLVDAGADVNASDNNKTTPLIQATCHENIAVVQYLVGSGASVNSVDNEGQSALIHAAKKRSWNIVRFLIKNGAEINAMDNSGWTSLMYTTQSGNLDEVQFLLNAGADVGLVNTDGRTAIFIASTQGYTDIQRLLMQNMPHDHQTKREMSTQIPVNCFVPAFDIKLQQFTGSENIGGEYRALWLDAEVVVKLFVPEASVTTFAHEVAVWHRLRHPNVIKLYGACDIGHNFFVCEWASNGSLVEYLSACEKRGEKKTPWKYLHEAALGLAYLHERKIVHGNLCSNSILVGSDRLVKLADFQVSGSSTISSSGRLDVDIGSYCWQAPERLKGEPSSLATDIYSFGLCAIAAVTGKTPWGGCLDDYQKSQKETWDAIGYPNVLNGPVPHGLTFELKMLVSKMCGTDPFSRLSAAEVVPILERLVSQESMKQQQPESKSELTADISEYNDGELLSQWQKLQDIASNIAVDQPELAVFRELEALYERLCTEDRPVSLLMQFDKLISDCIGAIDVSSHQYRILRLSSSKAQGHSMTAIYRRIDTIWAAIGDSHTTKELKLRREEQNRKQQNAFVSEISQTLLVLNELETDEAREAFVAYLKSEIDSRGVLYSTTQLNMLKQAYTDLSTGIKSDTVTTTPEWFLPWYELEVDGANVLAEGGFGEVYRAKWLESEVLVKQVKLLNSNNSDSYEVDSLLDITTSETESTMQNRKDMREMFQHEVEVWFGLSHPHVVRLFGACHVGTPLFACEYASNGSLDKYLRKHPNEMWQKMHETALGVQYLHSREIIHSDLKCNNIVVGGDNKAKVTDFGLSSANVVTGAWHWVAPECLERGPSELSYASDIYAFGMCIVEALRIVETTTTKNRVLLPWGNLDNNVVKYHVTHGKLPSRPKLCTDDEWDLIKRMCTYEPKERIKISTVVDELAALAGVNKAESPEVVEPESVKLSREEFDEMKRLCRKEEHDQQETSSTNQVLLQTVYGILWDRLEDVCAMPNVESRCLQSLFDNAWVSTRKLNQCPNTLTSFTEMAINGYALHRELDKVIDANFWVVDSTSGELHDWKMKCTTVVSTPELNTMKQENDDQ